MLDARKVLEKLVGTRSQKEIDACLADLRAEAQRDPREVLKALKKVHGAPQKLDELRSSTSGGAAALTQGIFRCLEALARPQQDSDSGSEGKKKKKKKKRKKEDTSEPTGEKRARISSPPRPEAGAGGAAKAAKAAGRQRDVLGVDPEEDRRLNVMAAKLLRGDIGGQLPCFLSLRRFTRLKDVAWERLDEDGNVFRPPLIGGGQNDTDSSFEQQCAE